MISLIDFVKAFNSNLEYRILIVVDEKCDVFSGNKEEFIKHIALMIIMYNMSISMLMMIMITINRLKMDTVYTLMLILLTTLMILP